MRDLAGLIKAAERLPANAPLQITKVEKDRLMGQMTPRARTRASKCSFMMIAGHIIQVSG